MWSLTSALSAARLCLAGMRECALPTASAMCTTPNPALDVCQDLDAAPIFVVADGTEFEVRHLSSHLCARFWC
jgi:hypothetical protein